MKKYWKIPVLIFLVALLVFVRIFERKLFFDAHINFFESMASIKTQGVFQWDLFFNITARYWINSILSLLILYVAFLKKEILKFAGLFYGTMYLLLVPLFFILRLYLNENDYLALFYVRRFLIHPLFILLLLPAFYYQQLKHITK